MARNTQTVSFGLGGNSPLAYALNPQAVQSPVMRVANQALASGTSSDPVQSWGEGATRLGQALLGGFFANRERQRGEEATGRLADSVLAAMPEAQRTGPQGQMLAAALRDRDLAATVLPQIIQGMSRQPEAPSGYRFRSDGGLEIIPGGPQDPAVLRAAAEAGRDPIISTPDGPYARSALLPGAQASTAASSPQPGPLPGGAALGSLDAAQITASGTSLPGVPGRAPPTNPGGMIVPGTGTGPDNPIRYQQFATVEEGQAAMQRQLLRNAQRIAASGQPVTLQTLIGHQQYGWAPGGVHGNRPDIYVRNLVDATGLRPDQPVDLSNPQVMAALTAGITRQEGVAAPQGGAGAPGAATPTQVASAAPGGAQGAPQGAPAVPAVTELLPDRSGQAPVAPPPVDPGNLVLRRNPGALSPSPTPAQIGQARSARGEFFGNPEVRNSLRVANVLTSMEDAAGRDSAASDLNMIYGLMTILDPGSVVREGETTMVRQTQAIPDWLMGTYQRLSSGGAALQTDDRQRIMTEARSRAQAQLRSYGHMRDSEEGFLRASNLNPDAVLGPRLSLPAPARPPQGSGGGAAAPTRWERGPDGQMRAVQ